MRVLQFIAMFFCATALAAQTGTVVTSGAAILEFPIPGSKKLREASKGETFKVSNLPTEGYFKVRLGPERYGWISGNDLLVAGVPLGVVAPSAVAAPPKAEIPEDSGEFWGDSTRILLGAGVHDLVYGGLSDNFIGASDLNLGFHFSAELQRKIFYLVYWALRIERMSAVSGDQLISSTTLQSMTSSALPVEVGILFHPIHARKFRVGLGMYVGASFMTFTEVSQTTSAQTSSVRYSSIDPVGTAALQATWGWGKRVGLFGELAWRYHVTGPLDSTTVLDPLNPVPGFRLNYSGLFLKGGLEFRF